MGWQVVIGLVGYRIFPIVFGSLEQKNYMQAALLHTKNEHIQPAALHSAYASADA